MGHEDKIPAPQINSQYPFMKCTKNFIPTGFMLAKWNIKKGNS
jgi:hypothetical protein